MKAPATATLLAFAAATIIALALPDARADTVRLKNGDRISGRVVAKRDGALVFRTEYAGEVRIRWSEIEALDIAEPVEVMRRDGAPRLAAVASSSPGHATLVAPNGTYEEVELARIEYINPRPFESGQGIAWSGHVNASATLTRGNVEQDQFYGEGRVEGRAKAYRFSIGGKTTHARDRKGEIANQWLVEGNFDRFLAERRFLYSRASVEVDRFKDLDHRATLGAGHGWQIADSADRKLELRAGVDFVHVDRTAGDDERYPALGWGVRYEQWPFARRLRVFHEQEGFLRVDELSDVVVRSRTGIAVPLYTGIDATAQLNVDWDSEPAPDRRSVDAVWLLGLGYKW